MVHGLGGTWDTNLKQTSACSRVGNMPQQVIFTEQPTTKVFVVELHRTGVGSGYKSVSHCEPLHDCVAGLTELRSLRSVVCSQGESNVPFLAVFFSGRVLENRIDPENR